MTLSAMAQRSRIYKSGTTEKTRRPFQESLHALLEKLAKSYALTVSGREHLQNIQRLSSELSTKHAEILLGGTLRIGAAQKALNLYLKYLWCLGEIAEPPHFPVDAVVLQHIKPFRDIRWTQLDDIQLYERIVEAARAESKGESLAVWELRLYNKAT